MEFMNDFLEKEAVPMKQFLKDISSPLSKEQCYSKFDDYIDVCKNLSILYTLLSESLTKVTVALRLVAQFNEIFTDSLTSPPGGTWRPFGVGN